MLPFLSAKLINRKCRCYPPNAVACVGHGTSTGAPEGGASFMCRRPPAAPAPFFALFYSKKSLVPKENVRKQLLI